MNNVERIAAFADTPNGGNPAGVWIGEAFPDDQTMQAIAAEVGYSETAFVTPTTGLTRNVRYFSPVAEVPFCGHATIAAASALGGTEDGVNYVFTTQAGSVTVRVQAFSDEVRATLTSVPTRQTDITPARLAEYLEVLGWSSDDLDTSVPPTKAYAGAWHLVIALKSRAQLASLEYDFDTLRDLMLADDLTTLQLVHRDAHGIWHSRNPFPVGGVYEDPATGAAAAALGGYLRDKAILTANTTFEIHQGDDMGRPSRLKVFLPRSDGIEVSGGSLPIP